MQPLADLRRGVGAALSLSPDDHDARGRDTREAR
jgi:hypothetical protein